MKNWIAMALLACSVSAWAAPQWTQAHIVKIEAEKARVTLKHQRIESLGMEAMTMPFKVADGVALSAFKVGDKVRFTVAERDDHWIINAMEPAK